MEGSRIFNADLDAFKSKMQREDASTPCLNSTDHLLDAFLKNGHLNSTESTDDAGDYSADDFEDVEVVEEDFDMSSVSILAWRQRYGFEIFTHICACCASIKAYLPDRNVACAICRK